MYNLFIPGHCAGDVLGVTASSKLPVFKECRWGRSTVWYTIPVNWLVWNELREENISMIVIYGDIQ